MYKKHVSLAIISLLLVGSFIGLASFIKPVAAQTPAWDFECHTYTHPHLTSLTAAEIDAEYQQVNSDFVAHGLAIPQHTAYPYGEYNDLVITETKKYRISARTVSGTMETTYPVPDWYQLKAEEMKTVTPWATIQGWVDSAIAAKGLLNLFTHDVRAHPGPYGMKPEVLTQLLDYLVTKQIAGALTVLPIRDAYTAWDGSKTVVVVSFDDGYYTDYTTVWPMFKARGLVGTSFIYTQAVNNNYKNNLNWAQVEEMAEASPPDTTPPAAPKRLSARTASSSQINLKWTANTETDLAKYRVYRNTTPGVIPGSGTFLANTTVNAYSDTGLTTKTTYYYVVTAVDTSDNESPLSNEASATTR